MHGGYHNYQSLQDGNFSSFPKSSNFGPAIRNNKFEPQTQDCSRNKFYLRHAQMQNNSLSSQDTNKQQIIPPSLSCSSSFYHEPHIYGSSSVTQELVQTQNYGFEYSFQNSKMCTNNYDPLYYKNHNINLSYNNNNNNNNNNFNNSMNLNCTKIIQQTKNKIIQTPRIRVRDVLSLNKTVSTMSVNSNVEQPQNREQFTCFLDYLSRQNRKVDNPNIKEYENTDMSSYTTLSDVRFQQHEFLMQNQPFQKFHNTLQNSFQSQTANNIIWSPEDQSHPKNNRQNENNFTVNDLSQSLDERNSNQKVLETTNCIYKLNNVCSGNRRIKNTPKKCFRPKEDSHCKSLDKQNKNLFINSPDNFKNISEKADNNLLTSLFEENNKLLFNVSVSQNMDENLIQNNESFQIASNQCIQLKQGTYNPSANLNLINNHYNSSDIENMESKEKNSKNSNLDIVHNNVILNSNIVPSESQTSVFSLPEPNNTLNEIQKTQSISKANHHFGITSDNSNPNSEEKEKNSEVKSFTELNIPITVPLKIDQGNNYLNKTKGSQEMLVDIAYSNKPEIIKKNPESNDQKQAVISGMKNPIKPQTTSTIKMNEQININVEDSVLIFKKPGPKSKTSSETLCATESHTQEHFRSLINQRKDDKNSSDRIEKNLSCLEKKYENKINRKKLDLLKKFIEGNNKSIIRHCEDPKERTSILLHSESKNGIKRKHEKDISNCNRRKLSKNSVVKNKNNNREMISLVCHKSSRQNSFKDVDKCLNFKNTLKENLSVTFKTENRNAETTTKNEIYTKHDENFSAKNSCSSLKENVENSKRGINLNSKTELLESGKLSSDLCRSKQKAFEQLGILDIIEAFPKLQHYYCDSCDLNPSVDSFWVNIVSGELKCLTCLKKNPVETTMTVLKSNNVLESKDLDSAKI